MTRTDATRYRTFDAMRGMAAIAVALFHFDGASVPHGYLAVDLFFALSGFVLENAYEERFRRGLTAGAFMEMRFVRLWPLLFAGIVLGTAYVALMRVTGVATFMSWPTLVHVTIFNVTAFPDPFTPDLYPCNAAFWSIATELLINAVFAFRLHRMSGAALGAVAVGAAIALALMAQAPHYADSGTRWTGIPLGLARTALSFVIGLMIARTARRWRRRRSGIATIGSIALLYAVLFAGVPVPGRYAFDLVGILLIFPALIVLGALTEPPAWFDRSSALLGDLSYPVYALHIPIASGALVLAQRAGLAPAALLLPYLAVIFALAWAAARWWDIPIRRLLSRCFAVRRSAMPIVV